MNDLAETILRDVKAYDWYGEQDNDGPVVLYSDVLAALTAALDPAIAERAGEVLERLEIIDPYEEPGRARDAECDAIDLITALLAQNAALRAERDRYLRHLTAGAESLNAYKTQIAALTARVERLTGALQIAKSIFDTPIGLRRLGIDPNADERLIEFRAALSATTEAEK